MGMSIDEIIQGIEVIKAQAEWEYPLDWQIVLDDAIDIMRKYQKIGQIVNAEFEEYYPLDRNSYRLALIRKVVEDGNNN